MYGYKQEVSRVLFHAGLNEEFWENFVLVSAQIILMMNRSARTEITYKIVRVSKNMRT